MQYFICNKKNSKENIIIRINDSDNTQYVEYFDYDGNFKKCDLVNLNLGDEVQEISPSQFEKIKNANYKFYFCKKTEPMLLIRIFNDVYLQIYDEDSVIEGLYFSGYHLEPATEVELQGEQVPYNKFVETGLTYDDFDEIEKPIMNGVYTILKKSHGLVADEIPPEEIGVPPEETESVELPPDKIYALLLEEITDSCNRYIWHEGQWKLFTDDNDILCNVDGMIDYFCEIMKGVYAR